MPVILDGYNLLFAIAHLDGASVGQAIEDACERLLRQLSAYRHATGEAVTVVFDSRRAAGGARQEETVGGLRVVYSHPPRTADDEIRSMVEASAAPRRLRVVTSDRELGAACARRGAAVVGARAFYRELTAHAETEREDSSEQFIKQQAPSDDELRYFLEAFGDADAAEEGRQQTLEDLWGQQP